MAMEKSTPRVAMVLLCGLAICCAVMYITADGSDVQETILAAPAEAKPVFDSPGPTSVSSTDVEKVGTVFTNTPDGRMRLTDYLTNVEKEIAAEEAARKRDVDSVRAQMARNFAFNEQARSKLQKALLAKMAANAKQAKNDLDTGMRYVQAKFAAMAKLQNERNDANIEKSKKIRALIQANKEEAAKDLAQQVATQQRAMTALASAVNARITKTNKHIAANAAAIKENAKKAREDLDAAVAKFDQKAAEARSGAAAGRDKLAAQLAEQDKSIREWATNHIKVVMAKTAAQFRRAREHMAEDRMSADLALKASTSKMDAALNAATALNDERFAKTVKDIAAAKAEAKALVEAAETSFKISLFKLSATVNEQVQLTNTRIDQLSNTVTNHKTAQAKINANVAAETKRIIKLGDDRYAEHLKKDAELHNLINANKAATDARMQAMGAHYMAQLNEVRATMNKNRAHATKMLSKNAAKLYGAIEKSERAQMATNANMQGQLRSATLEVADSLREAKEDFATRIGDLHRVVADNDKKFEGKIDELSGIVRANAVKNDEGRAQLKTLMDANKAELQASVRDAITQGETRMAAAESKLVDLNAKTKAALNMKITTEISELTKRANNQIEGLRLSSKESRAEMKKELLYAVRSMADEAKKNLDAATKEAAAVSAKVAAQEAAAAGKSASVREAVAKSVEIEADNAKLALDNAVATLQKSLLVLQTQTRAAIKKENTSVTAYADALKKNAVDVDALVANQIKTLATQIKDKQVTFALNEAASDASAKFGKAYEALGDRRAALDNDLAAAVVNINDSIAKQAALADSRFEKTVKDLGAAKKEAADQVKYARQQFATDLAVLTADIKAQETRLQGDIRVVTGAVVSDKAAQTTVNRHVDAELNRVEALMNKQVSESKKARGQLRAILDENKRAAAEEVAALSGLFKNKIQKIRAQAADNAFSAKSDLTAASEHLYEALAKNLIEQHYENEEKATAYHKYTAEQLASAATTQADFEQRLKTLANVISANHKTVERGLEVLTGTLRDFDKAGEKDRALLEKQNEAINADLQKHIVQAIQIGEAKGKAFAQRAQDHLSDAKKSMLVEITNTVDTTADTVFALTQDTHQKIADNYLSLKAYAVTASNAITKYVGVGKGKNLSSLGDLLINIAALGDVTTSATQGISPSNAVYALFDGGFVKIDNSASKINGLVNEFVDVQNNCRSRWPMGLGKYLLLKLTASMEGAGVLQVDKIEGRADNYVFLNGHAVGLSNKLNDFETLAVKMAAYEANLAKLTATLSGKVYNPTGADTQTYVPPPEWHGD